MRALNAIDDLIRYVQINVYTAMEIDNIAFNHDVIVNETITFTATLVEPMDVCFMFHIYHTETSDWFEPFWLGVPTSVCTRSNELFGLPFNESPTSFNLMEAGALVGTIERTIDVVGEYEVYINAFAPFGTSIVFRQPLTVTPVPCFDPVLTLRPGPGNSMTNPVLFKRSNINSIGTDKVSYERCNIT